MSAGNCFAIPCREQILQSKICEGNEFASERKSFAFPLSAQIFPEGKICERREWLCRSLQCTDFLKENL